MNALELAIKAAGSQVALAEAMTSLGKKTSQQNISWWLKEAKGQVPAEYVPFIERATGVSRHDLRPDVFGDTSEQAAAA